MVKTLILYPVMSCLRQTRTDPVQGSDFPAQSWLSEALYDVQGRFVRPRADASREELLGSHCQGLDCRKALA